MPCCQETVNARNTRAQIPPPVCNKTKRWDPFTKLYYGIGGQKKKLKVERCAEHQQSYFEIGRPRSMVQEGRQIRHGSLRLGTRQGFPIWPGVALLCYFASGMPIRIETITWNVAHLRLSKLVHCRRVKAGRCEVGNSRHRLTNAEREGSKVPLAISSTSSHQEGRKHTTDEPSGTYEPSRLVKNPGVPMISTQKPEPRKSTKT